MLRNKSIFGSMMVFVLCFGLVVPAWAAKVDDNASKEVMPSQIIASLLVQKITDEDSILGMKNIVAVQNELLANITLPTSLNIDTINIDMNKVHQTYPLTDDQIHQLKLHGYTDDEIAELDMGDYFNIEAAWPVDSSIYSAIKFLYPALADVDLTGWTNADLQAYSSAEDEKKYAPTKAEAKALAERNITLADARNLLKDYYNYKGILAQSDEKLAQDIEKYYQFTLDNIYKMAQYEKNSKINLKKYPPTNPNSNYYIKTNLSGYKKD